MRRTRRQLLPNTTNASSLDTLVRQVSGEVLPRNWLLSWMKLVDVATVAPGADAERSAEFRSHMRLIAITKLGGESGEGLIPVPQGKAEPGQAAQALERAQRHPGSGAKGLGDIDRMVVRNAGDLAEAPAAARLVANGFDHSGDPSAAVRPSHLRRIEIADDFGRQRGQRKLFVRVRSELERQLFRCDPDRCRTPAFDLRTRLAFRRMQIDADRAPGAEAVVMRLAGVMREDATAQPLPKAVAFVLGKAAGKDQADIVVRMLVRRDLSMRAMRGEGQQLAAGGARGDHVIGHPEIERLRFISHASKSTSHRLAFAGRPGPHERVRRKSLVDELTCRLDAGHRQARGVELRLESKKRRANTKKERGWRDD